MIEPLCFLLGPIDGRVTGTWERRGDIFGGCQVAIELAGREAIARIVAMPEIMRQAGWVVGDAKWRQVRQDGGAWTLLDARKKFEPGAGRVLDIDYIPCRVEFGFLGMMRLQGESAQPQYWRRVDG